MAGECILYYSLYNSNAADAVGPPDREPNMEPALDGVKVMQLRLEARSTTTSISGSKRTRRRGTGLQALRCHAGGAYLEASGDAFGDHDITPCRFDWRISSLLRMHSGQANRALHPYPSPHHSHEPALHRIAQHIIAPATTACLHSHPTPLLSQLQRPSPPIRAAVPG